MSTSTLAADVGEFAAAVGFEDVPAEVTDRAKHLILDSIGIAFASTSFGFAEPAAAALGSFGAGDTPVFGLPHRLPVREAAVLNGVLIHGLDFDDTHIGGIVHVTSSALPAALASAVHNDRSCRELLLGYVLAVEISARIGIGAAGKFHDIGYHPTGVAGAFGAAVAAGRLSGLDAVRIASAQGTVGSMAAGLFEFLEDGSWTKRQHPGWAASCGLTAAAFAGQGWVGPPTVYEGRFGLYATHLPGMTTDPAAVSRDLGTRWELMNTAVKPYPTCHFTHAFVDLVLELLDESGASAADIDTIRCAIHPVPGKAVCEPEANKRRPKSDYDAKFSLPFIVAATALRRRFTLAELEPEALADKDILALTDRVQVVPDSEGLFPDAYSGAVEIVLRDGRTLSQREQVNRGHADRPLSNEEIVRKFYATIGTVADKSTAERVHDAVFELGTELPAAKFAELCRSS